MKLEQMHYIIEVAKTKSLTMAANNLNVTQSAVSQSIASLESEFGLPIFIRSRTGVVPTKEGLSIIQTALEVVTKLQDMKERVLRLSQTMQAELQVASIPGVMSSLVKTVSSFKNDYPDVSFRIIEANSDLIMQEIRQNKVDLGLVGMRGSTTNEAGITFEPIWEGKIVVGVWQNSPLAAKKKITPAEMRKLSFALYDETYIHDFLHDFSEDHGKLSILFRSNNPNAIATALKENLAATFGYDFSFFDSPYALNGSLVMLEIDEVEQIPIQLGWVRSDTDKNVQISNLFIQRFLQHFQNKP
ncbi:LysR family transcriptional regulator [Paenibacillus sp. Soil750]|uniref:LysR family transcriptional regulator n=1 Tax=Paenibacillus sp. Soil750 TaxID=1736398 RepID=UPI0006FB8899|nr:LysR family transcriptional regulator [Paenibacillus sp. Soil750]KRE59629.1 hypothetical protein ASL11_25720 [Paenibacillus sp. Soil750]